MKKFWTQNLVSLKIGCILPMFAKSLCIFCANYTIVAFSCHTIYSCVLISFSTSAYIWKVIKHLGNAYFREHFMFDYTAVATTGDWLYPPRYSNHVNFPFLRNWRRPLFMATRQLNRRWLESSKVQAKNFQRHKNKSPTECRSRATSWRAASDIKP